MKVRKKRKDAQRKTSLVFRVLAVVTGTAIQMVTEDWFEADSSSSRPVPPCTKLQSLQCKEGDSRLSVMNTPLRFQADEGRVSSITSVVSYN